MKADRGPSQIPTSDELARSIKGQDAPGFEPKERGRARMVGGTISGFSGGGVQVLTDDGQTASSKPHRVFLPFDGTEQVGDRVVKIEVDGQTVVGRIGEPTDLSVGWVAPGDNTLLEALAERSTADNAYLDNKVFFVTRPGRYRITTELKSSLAGVTAFARVIFRVGQVFDNSIVGHTRIASPEVSVVGATYTARTMDMNVTAPSGMALVVQTRASVNGQSAFLKDTRVRYQNATSAPGQLSFVILD